MDKDGSPHLTRSLKFMCIDQTNKEYIHADEIAEPRASSMKKFLHFMYIYCPKNELKAKLV